MKIKASFNCLNYPNIIPRSQMPNWVSCGNNYQPCPIIDIGQNPTQDPNGPLSKLLCDHYMIEMRLKALLT